MRTQLFKIRLGVTTQTLNLMADLEEEGEGRWRVVSCQDWVLRLESTTLGQIMTVIVTEIPGKLFDVVMVRQAVGEKSEVSRFESTFYLEPGQHWGYEVYRQAAIDIQNWLNGRH